MGAHRSALLGLVAVTLLVSSSSLSAQQATVTGTITDSETGQPLAQAQVQLVSIGGASSGTLSDAQGRFRLTAAAGSYRVAVTLLGYETVTIDGVQISAGGTRDLQIAMTTTALALDPIVVTGTRGVEVRSSAAPAHVEVVEAAQIQERAATTPVDYVKGLPGVDVAQTGLTQSNTVTRGFNNVFSGAMLVLTDNRYARVPSLRLNAYNMIPANALDVDRVEMVLGPASALYGPNSANGVMHIITTSPIDHPGSSLTLSGGERSIFQGAFREAYAFNERAGLKVSGQYFRGHDFEYVDPAETAALAAKPTDPLIANRDYDAERFGGEARFDYRPWDDGEIIATYGFNQLVSSIELTGIGAGQARDWRYQFGQVRVNKGRLFAQAFRNWSDAGSKSATDTDGTYLLRTGQPIVDKSSVVGAQVQYGMPVGDRLDLTGGFDYTYTDPVTEGTITGSNEDSDQTTELGGYLHGQLELNDMLDLVGALRVDKHEHLEDPVFSPRAGLVFHPEEGQSFRLTYNRAFSTPTTNNLFLDIVAGSIPLTPTVGYDIRTFGVPATGLTFNDTCGGTYCMYSAFDPTNTAYPALGFVLWDPVLIPAALSNPALVALLASKGWTPGQFQTAVAVPTAADLTTVLLRFNSEDPTGPTPFLPDPGISAVDRIRPTITTTYEAGYKGLIGDKLLLAADVYRSDIHDFVGPLRVETPNVFLTPTSIATYVTTRLVGGGMSLADATAVATAVAAGVAPIPIGTIAPDQHPGSDLILTYRNFGDISLWGADLGFEAHATDVWTVTGSYSWVSKECYDFDENGSCSGTTDVALNAPTNKASVGLRFDDRVTGIAAEGRVRYSDQFPMNSGVYVGTVDSYAVFDLNAAYRVPGYAGLVVSLTVNNVLDNKHQEFIGAPQMGRLGLIKLQYQF